MKLFSVNTTDGKQHWFSAGYKAKRFLIDFNKDAKTKDRERKKLRAREKSLRLEDKERKNGNIVDKIINLFKEGE